MSLTLRLYSLFFSRLVSPPPPGSYMQETRKVQESFQPKGSRGHLQIPGENPREVRLGVPACVRRLSSRPPSHAPPPPACEATHHANSKISHLRLSLFRSRFYFPSRDCVSSPSTPRSFQRAATKTFIPLSFNQGGLFLHFGKT